MVCCVLLRIFTIDYKIPSRPLLPPQNPRFCSRSILLFFPKSKRCFIEKSSVRMVFCLLLFEWREVYLCTKLKQKIKYKFPQINYTNTKKNNFVSQYTTFYFQITNNRSIQIFTNRVKLACLFLSH